MRAILDAHALLWFLAGSNKLSRKALDFIQNPDHTLLVSPATLWEISIKDALGKPNLPLPYETLFPESLETSNIQILPILVPHLHCQRRLPTFHNDPFDRMLIAQSLSEEITLISCDSHFPQYGVKLLW
jgi:PIN domain nuclease of toxin-antitoxin system